jgi:poly(3-hydroxybutyrate) depolymerase
MKTTILTLLCFVALTVSAQKNKMVPMGTIPGQIYGYALYHPDTAAKKILISLHGVGQKGDMKGQLSKVLNEGVARAIERGEYKRTEFIVISPQRMDDFAYPETLYNFIQFVCKQYKIATDQIYLTGISGGGISSFRFLHELKDLNAKFSSKPPIEIRAFVAVAADDPHYTKAPFCEVPMMAIYGLKDTTIRLNKLFLSIKAYNECAAVKCVEVVEPLFGHDTALWYQAYKLNDIYDFLLKY